MKQSLNLIITLLLTWTTCYAQSNEKDTLKQKKAVVFIVGEDEGNNTYYTNAKGYFTNGNYLVVDGLSALSQVLGWIRLHYDPQIYKDLHIVSHSNPWFGLSMKINTHSERITEPTLKLAIKTSTIIPLGKNRLSSDTKIIFHTCGLGKNKKLLSLLKKAITVNPLVTVYASEAFNVFGGKYNSHYLAKTYFGFYPTAQSPGPRQLAMEFKTKYPGIKVDWEQVLKTRTEQLSGAMYTYKFNIPVDWEFEFENRADLPQLTTKNDIMSWIEGQDAIRIQLEAFQIPIEKYRWICSTNGNTMYIKGKTTVLCVLQPILNDNAHEVDAPINYESDFYLKL